MMMQGLTFDLMESLLGYSTAPVLERRCLFVVAARTDPRDLEQYRAAFREFDTDANGRVSYVELAEALRVGRNRFAVHVDVDSLYRALDLDASGVVNFTKFVAACLHKRLAPLDAWLAQQAFESLDRDNVGTLRAQQVRPLFGELPRGLPRSRAFTLEEWKRCLLGGDKLIEGGIRTPTSCGVGCSAGQRQPGGLLGLLGLFSGCQTSREEDFVIESVKSRRSEYHWSDEQEEVDVYPRAPLPPPPASNGSSPGPSPRPSDSALPPPPPAWGFEWRRLSAQDQDRYKSAPRFTSSSPSYIPASAL